MVSKGRIPSNVKGDDVNDEIIVGGSGRTNVPWGHEDVVCLPKACAWFW